MKGTHLSPGGPICSAHAVLRRGVLATLTALAAAAALATPAAAQRADDAREARRGRAAIAGIVRDTAGRPLADVFVGVEGAGATTFSDGKGWFGLSELPDDTVLVTVRRIGYRPVDFEIALMDGKTVEMVLQMRPVVQELGTILVEGERRELKLYQNGFYRRQQGAAAGTFFGPKEMDGPLGQAPFSMLVRNAPGIQLDDGGKEKGLQAYMRLGNQLCRMPVFVDGVQVRWAADVGLDRIVMPGSAQAVEIYGRNASLPPEFMLPGFHTCGAIVVWSKSPSNERDVADR